MARKLVVVIEDQQHNIELMTFQVQQAGCQLKIARTERESLAVIDAVKEVGTPVLFLVDVSLVGNDGEEGIGLMRKIIKERDEFREKVELCCTSTVYSETVAMLGVKQISKLEPHALEERIRKFATGVVAEREDFRV